jgi:hypothetical protein
MNLSSPRPDVAGPGKPAFADRDSTIAKRLAWEQLNVFGEPVDHLDPLIRVVPESVLRDARLVLVGHAIACLFVFPWGGRGTQ